MADNITVKDANGNDVVMRSTQQTLDEVTVVQVAHHIPEGEILEVLQKMAYLLEDIAAKLVLPVRGNLAAGEIPARIASSAISVNVIGNGGNLTSIGTLGNITSLGNVPSIIVGNSQNLLMHDSERERIVTT
jgi:hypothetical protein